MNSGDIDPGLKIYLKEIWKTPLLTLEEEKILAKKMQEWDLKAREHMIEANLRLVVFIAQHYANYWLSLKDLISEGNIWLMKAADRYDLNKGWKFYTYARWWIKQSMKRALANQWKTIRLPVHIGEKISKIRRAAMSMSEDLGREPTDDELSEELGIERAKIAQLKTANLRPASLDAPVSDSDATEFGELIWDEHAQTPFESLSQKNMEGQLDWLLEALDDREIIIIRQRFWLHGAEPKALEEVWQEFWITRERVRQLQNVALKKLRRVLNNKEKPKNKEKIMVVRKLKSQRLQNGKKPKIDEERDQAEILQSAQTVFEWLTSKLKKTFYDFYITFSQVEWIEKRFVAIARNEKIEAWGIRMRRQRFLQEFQVVRVFEKYIFEHANEIVEEWRPEAKIEEENCLFQWKWDSERFKYRDGEEGIADKEIEPEESSDALWTQRKTLVHLLNVASVVIPGRVLAVLSQAPPEIQIESWINDDADETKEAELDNVSTKEMITFLREIPKNERQIFMQIYSKKSMPEFSDVARYLDKNEHEIRSIITSLDSQLEKRFGTRTFVDYHSVFMGFEFEQKVALLALQG